MVLNYRASYLRLLCYQSVVILLSAVLYYHSSLYVWLRLYPGYYVVSCFVVLTIGRYYTGVLPLYVVTPCATIGVSVLFHLGVVCVIHALCIQPRHMCPLCTLNVVTGWPSVHLDLVIRACMYVVTSA